MNRSRTDLTAAGPAASAEWEVRRFGAGPGRPLSLLITPDSANPAREASGLPPLYHYLPSVPHFAINRAGGPIFSLTLVLTRQPDPGEDNLQPLVDRGILATSLTLQVPDSDLQQLAEAAQAEFKPLFAREVTFRLARSTDGDVLEGQSGGAGSSAALSANLNQAETLALLTALQGGESGLVINAHITYRTAATPGQTLLLQGSWERIYEQLAAQFPLDTEFDGQQLRQAFSDLLLNGTVLAEVNGTSGEPQAQDEEGLFRGFLRVASVILKRLTLDLEPGDPANRYSLRAFAPTGMELYLEQKVTASGGGEEFIELSAPLEELFNGVFEGQAMDGYIHLVAPGADGSFGPVPQRVRQTRSPVTRGPAKARLVTSTVATAALPLALQTNTQIRPAAHALLLSDTVHMTPIRPGLHQHWALDDVVLADLSAWHGIHDNGDRNLPQVDDPAAALWPDRRDANRFWYAPVYEPVLPAKNQGPSGSPFLFTFSTAGHDLTGQVGLQGTIRFTLQRSMSPATRQALQERGNPSASPVAADGLSVALDMPFRDQQGETRRQLFPAEIEVNGDTVTATVSLIDNWVRLMYGALAFDGFQAEPARVRVSYSYTAYVPVQKDRWEVIFGGKIAETPIIRRPEDLDKIGNRPYLDALTNTLHLQTGKLQFMRELPAQVRAGGPTEAGSTEGEPVKAAAEGTASPAKGRGKRKRSGERPPEPEEMLPDTGSAPPATLEARPAAPYAPPVTRPAPESTEAPPPAPHDRPAEPKAGPLAGPAAMPGPRPTLAMPNRPASRPPLNLPIALNPALHTIHPELTIRPDLLEIIEQTQYALQTLGVTQTPEVLFACADYGALYVQETAQGQETVGCRDAFKLGQAEFRQYRLMTEPELRSPFYTVYRSLQMPDRFLMVPAAYRITRFGPQEGDKAYRPAIYLYSQIDANRLEESHCVVWAVVQPDIPPYARQELADRLSLLYHRPPLIETVTEVESQVTYEWNLLNDGPHPVVAQVAKLWDSFQVSLLSDVNGVQNLQSMLQAGAVAARVVFNLPDGSTLDTGLRLNLGSITGPWEGGPLETELQGGTVELTNRIERPVDVSDLRLYLAGGEVQTLAVDQQLAPGERWSGAAAAGTAQAFPVYAIPPGAPADLVEIRSFIEDIHTNVVFINQVNYANHGLQKLDVQASILGMDGVFDLPIPGEETVAALDLVLPLTTFLANPVLRFRVIKTGTDGQSSQTPWIDWPLSAMGSVVSLTWDLIKGTG